jgi:hypothetical protein
MSRRASVAVFAGLYFATIVFVCLLNAAYIVRDAVVGPLFVAAIYAIYFSPAVIVAVISLVVAPVDDLLRLRLSVGFAVAIGTVLELVLAEGELQWFGRGFLNSDVAFVVGVNAVLVAVFLISAIVATRRARRAAAKTAA